MATSAIDGQIVIEPVLVGSQNFINQAGRAGALAGETFSRKFNYSLGRITGNSNEFERSMAASNARVLAFGASAGGIYAIASAFKKLVESTILVEKELANINLYMNLGSNSLKQFSTNLFSIATKTASPFQDAAKAAMEFSRQGLTMNEVLKRTTAALSLARLTGMGMEESVTDLTSIMNSFNKESLDAIEVTNKLSSVGGKFAVSADAIAEALKRVGSSASDAGVHFDDMIALITSTQHITGRAASVIGTSFNTIFTRLQRPKVLEDLESVGVQVRNTSGAMLPMMDVIKNLSTRYEGLSTSQKSFISETVGGVRQLNTLKALFMDLGGGYSIYGRAMDAAANSTGIAQKRISALNETISSSLQQTSTAWQEVLSNIGNLTIAPIIKGGTKGLTSAGQEFAKLTNPNTLNSDSARDRNNATLYQGGLKSLGNILSGPGLQVGVTILYKLFDKLAIFAVNSTKDLMGVNKVVKDRAVIEQRVNEMLAKQPNLLDGVINKEKFILSLINLQSQAREKNNLIAQSTAGYAIRTGQSSGVAGLITGGKVPGAALPESVSNALLKENIATHGHAKLSSHPSLVSDQNPLGLVAIDGRIQGNAAQAIRQHMALGQSLNDIKSGNNSKIPGLAMDSTLLASAAMGFGGGWVNTHKYDNDDYSLKVRKILLKFGDAVDKQIYTIQKLTAVQDKLASGKDVESFNLPGDKRNYGPYKGVNAQSQFNKDFKQEQYSEAELANLQQSKASKQNFGMKLAIGAAIAGGMTSTMFQNDHPNVSRGFEKGFGDLELAGQAKMFLPGKTGTAVAYGLAAQGIGDFIKEIRNGTANQERDFAKQQETVQKVNSSLDGLIQSISNLDQMALDSSVSFEALTREQRKYQEALNQFQGSGAHFEEIQKIRNAPNSKSRMRAIEELRESYNEDLENKGMNLNLDQLQSKRGGFLGMGKKDLFSWSNETEKTQSLSDINDVASRALANMSPSQKSYFGSQVMEQKNGYSNQNRIGIDDVIGNKNAYIRESLNKGSQNDRDEFLQQIKFLVTQAEVEKNPQVRQARLNAINQNQSIGLPLDMATRQEEMLKRLFVNSTAMNVNNTIQKSLVGQNIGFAGESIGLSARQGMAGILGLTAGQKTNIGFQEESEKMRADLEMRRKLASSNSNFTSKLMSPYTQNAEQWVVQNKDILTPGGNSQSISDTVKNFTESINKGLTGTVAQNSGNLSSFIGSNGQLNADKLHKSILENSGLNQGSTQYNNLASFLKSSTGSEEQLKEINAHLVENTQITMEGNQAIVEASIKRQAAEREYQIQQNSSILGGLQTPHQGLQIASQFRRSQSLMHSSNPIMAGIGALNYLKLSKQFSGLDVNLDDKDIIKTGANKGLYKETGSDNLTNEQHKAANIRLRGYTTDYKRTISRLGSGGANGALREEMERNLQYQGYGVGRDQLKNEIHPEGSTSMLNVSSQVKAFEKSLTEVVKPIDNFGDSLDGLAARINALDFEINRPGGTRETTTKAKDAVTAGTLGTVNLAAAGGTNKPADFMDKHGQETKGKIGFWQGVGGFLGDYATQIGGTALALGLGTKYGRGLLGKTFGGIKSGIGEFITKDRAWPWRTPKPMSRNFENIPSSKPLGGLRPGAVPPEIQPYYNSQGQGEFGISNEGGYENYPPLKKPTIIEQGAAGLSNQNVSPEELLKIRKSLDRPLHLTPQEMNQPFAHGGSKLTPNQLKEMGVLNVTDVVGEGQGQATGKHGVTFNENRTPAINPNHPSWVTHNLNALTSPLEKTGVANKIEELAAQRLTAGEISQRLNIPIEQVRAVRVNRGIPGMDMKSEFENWLKGRSSSTISIGNNPQIEIPPAIYRNKINTEAGLNKGFADITMRGTKSPINLFKKQNIMPSMGNVAGKNAKMMESGFGAHIPESWTPKIPVEPSIGGAVSGGMPAMNASKYEEYLKSMEKGASKFHGKGLAGLAVAGGLGLLALGSATSASAATFQDLTNNKPKDIGDYANDTMSLTAGLAPLAHMALGKFAPNSKVTQFLNSDKGFDLPNFPKILNKIPTLKNLSNKTPFSIGKNFKGFGWKGNLATMGLDIATGFIPSREDYEGDKGRNGLNTLENVASIAGYLPGGKLAYAGVKLGEGIDTMAYNKWIRPTDRMAAMSAAQNQDLLDKDSTLNQIQRMRGIISNVQHQEGVTRGDKGLSQETRDKRIGASEKVIEQLNASIDKLRETYDKTTAQQEPKEQNGTEGVSSNQPIQITISIEDLDKAPEIIKNGIIGPLAQQLARMSVEINNIKNNLGMSPNPSQVPAR